MKRILLPAVMALVFTACQNKTPDQDASLPVPGPLTDNIAADTANTATINTSAPAQLQNTQATMPANIAIPASMPVTAGLNPAHGQPGHRCEIAVGAPLNSAPAAKGTLAAAPQAIPAPQTTATTVSQPAPAKVAAGMNPAHGQPGHRCDIGVGEPLSSPVKAAPSATIQQPVTTPLNTPVTTAELPSAAQTTGANSGKINPAHGQPGHDCKIAVGAPIK